MTGKFFVTFMKFNGQPDLVSPPLSEIEAQRYGLEKLEELHADGYSIKPYVPPVDGGCWFCCTESEDMVFDSEFDTFLHLSCLKRELSLNPDNPEAKIMSYLLEGRHHEFIN